MKFERSWRRVDSRRGRRKVDRKEFLEKAKERFGDKIIVQTLTSDAEDGRMPWTSGEIKGYPEQAWIPLRGDDYLCPVCDHPLGGWPFGGFRWGIVYGIGYCSNCNHAKFRYCHHIVEGKKSFQAFALVEFEEEEG